VIVITFESLDSAAFAVAKTATEFSYFVDKERTLYKHYGLLKAGFLDLWGPRSWLVYLRLVLKGRKMLKTKSDIHQRGGDVLIDPQGVVRYHHIGTGPGDRPDPKVICNEVDHRY